VALGDAYPTGSAIWGTCVKCGQGPTWVSTDNGLCTEPPNCCHARPDADGVRDARKGFDVTDDELDAPDGAVIELPERGGWFERTGNRWEATAAPVEDTCDPETECDGGRACPACPQIPPPPQGYSATTTTVKRKGG
jgi:hypothetical protein